MPRSAIATIMPGSPPPISGSRCPTRSSRASNCPATADRPQRRAMADVILCYARDDAAAAGRLAAAVTQRGYWLWSETDLGSAGADITDRISGAKAAIVLWSEAAAASEWVRAEANFARGQKKLIQASADGRPPPLPFRAADMVSLSGWQGGEAHPGWRRIAAELEALCGAPGANRPTRPAA